MTQRLIIRFEDDASKSANEVRYEQSPDMISDDMFWLWFISAWDNLGISFVKSGIEKGQ